MRTRHVCNGCAGRRTFRPVLLAAIVCAMTMTGTIGRGAEKKLIPFSPVSPDFARQHYPEMDKTPFDGAFFLLGRGADRPHAGKPWSNLSWGCWGHRYFQWEDVQHFIAELQAAKFERVVNNFIMMTVVPGDVDWFDEFGPVIHNYRLAARIASQVPHVKGILLDTEAYGMHKYPQLFAALWHYDSNYGRQRYEDIYTYNEYVAQARLRGRQLMEAMQAEFPNLEVFITHSYALAWPNWHHNPSLAAEPVTAYNLLPAFLDGLHDVAGEKVKIVDGHEIAYRWKTKGEFEVGYKYATEDSITSGLVGSPEAYKRVRSIGFGLWMDTPAAGRTTDEVADDLSAYHFSPAEWEQALRYALERADEYVWIYTLPQSWPWRQTEPQAYYDATVRAREAEGLK